MAVWSYVEIDNLSEDFRLDAEHYQPEYLRQEKAMAKLPHVELRSVADVSDGNHMSIAEDFAEEGIRYLRGQDLSDFFISDADPIYIPEQTYAGLSRSHMFPGDVLVGIVGTIGSVGLVTKRHGKLTGNCKLAIIRARSLPAEYIATYLASRVGQNEIQRRVRGAVQGARTARVELRSVRVVLDGPWRPGGWQSPLPDVGVVEVRETPVPAGVQPPLHWILLTTLPCATQAQVQRVVGCYTARWWIEEYHKALKSGAGVEASQLEQGDRLESLIAVLAVVAVRLLGAKLLARSRPESFEAAAGFGPEMLAILEQKIGPPKGGWNNRNVLIAVARLGGFLARKHDGLPGWQTIWRGWQRLLWMWEGLETLQLK